MEELELSLRNPFDVLKIYALQCVQQSEKWILYITGSLVINKI
jgi:hypothetical protein